jgi:uncharacterized protein YndB with AHSA1/START domain
VFRPSGDVSMAAEFVFTRVFDASREDVWIAFTRPEHLKHWWGPPGCVVEVAHHELKPGGVFHYCMKFPDGRLMWARFVFREIVPFERLVWLNSFSDDRGGISRNPWVPSYPLETVNSVTFSDEDGKTLIKIAVTPANASEEEMHVFAAGINGMKAGFGACFNALAGYLAQQR